jgi:plasmid stabilization system protein ParE
MTRFRLARPAQADLKQILATSAERWGDESRRRYAAMLVAAMRHVAADPEGAVTRIGTIFFQVYEAFTCDMSVGIAASAP